MQAQPQVDYQQTRFGRYDPAVLVQARKRITTAADTWSALSRAATVPAPRLWWTSSPRWPNPWSSCTRPAMAWLLCADQEVVTSLARIGGAATTAELAMEVATSVLYLQAAFANT